MVAVDELGLVEAVDGLGQGVVIAVALGVPTELTAFGFGQALRVADGEVLDAPIGVVHESREVAGPRAQIAISRASRARSARRASMLTGQPTIARLKASIMKAV